MMEMPAVTNLGFLTALLVSGIVSGWCFKTLKPKVSHALIKSIVVACVCFLTLVACAIIGIIIIGSGVLGSARGWGAFGDGYIWGALLAPCLAFCLSLGAYILIKNK